MCLLIVDAKEQHGGKYWTYNLSHTYGVSILHDCWLLAYTMDLIMKWWDDV